MQMRSAIKGKSTHQESYWSKLSSEPAFIVSNSNESKGNHFTTVEEYMGNGLSEFSSDEFSDNDEIDDDNIDDGIGHEDVTPRI
jgi:hypothetical protein